MISKSTISPPGPITRQFDSPCHGDYCIFGPVWYSPDRSRIYTGCATGLRASKDPQLDMRYLSSLRGAGSIGVFAEPGEAHTIALIQGRERDPDPKRDDDRVLLFDRLSRCSPFRGVLPMLAFGA